jgi:hypothetical protein
METNESAPDALPEFETLQAYPYPLLPDGVHATDEAHFRAALVERFPGSITRQSICDGYFQFRRDLAAMGILATQWLDGSFVEGKQDPNDIDLVSFVDYDLLNGMTNEAHAFASTHLIGSGERRKSISAIASSCQLAAKAIRFTQPSRWLGRIGENGSVKHAPATQIGPKRMQATAKELSRCFSASLR